MKSKELKEELNRIKSQESEYLIPSYNNLQKKLISELIKPFRNSKINKVMAIDMKGLLYGPIIAYNLNLPFVPVIKGGKVNSKFVISKSIKDYSGKRKTFQIGKETVKKGDKILLVDDWFESGNTGKAVIEMIESLGGKVLGIAVIFNQLSTKDEKFFNKYNFHFIVQLKHKK